MARRLLQINFNLKVSRGDYEAEARDVAQMFADVPGLVWKVWLMNDERNGAGGIYLFESEQALNHYVGGPLVEALRSDPTINNLSIKPFEILDEITVVTRGPIDNAVPL